MVWQFTRIRTQQAYPSSFPSILSPDQNFKRAIICVNNYGDKYRVNVTFLLFSRNKIGKKAQFKLEFKPIWSNYGHFSWFRAPTSGQWSNRPYYFESFIAFDHADDPIWPLLTCIWLLKWFFSLSVIWIKKKRLEWWVGWRGETRIKTPFVITMTI